MLSSKLKAVLNIERSRFAKCLRELQQVFAKAFLRRRYFASLVLRSGRSDHTVRLTGSSVYDAIGLSAIVFKETRVGTKKLKTEGEIGDEIEVFIKLWGRPPSFVAFL